MDDPTSPIYGTKGYQAPEIARDRPDGPVRPLHRRPHARGAVHRTSAATRALRVHAAAAGRRAALRDATTRCTGSSLRATAPHPDDRFQTAKRWPTSSSACSARSSPHETGTPVAGAERAASPSRCAAAVDAPDWRDAARACSSAPTTRPPGTSRRCRPAATPTTLLALAGCGAGAHRRGGAAAARGAHRRRSLARCRGGARRRSWPRTIPGSGGWPGTAGLLAPAQRTSPSARSTSSTPCTDDPR